ncbi:hypothetical protein OIC43_03455 [Streptomyces sp. NBC_00825]|uniref:hypothetical protein n=1 Tax=unclassified Streptomyces TaxID=2593676 RepID=UPI002ED14B14|nr:hypothetical protein OG832_40260 [Streptomyces sp. NBC_00826]WTH88187.1 hypothetical protein OIC43_03455 [Streptomyces sp. NBC_00825]WTH96915.1 hypothetical protein OHA23_03455 [Streptomyces sp. NBC_00822]
MPDPELPRSATEPEAVISEIVRSADPACERIDVVAVLQTVFRQRPQLRTLAEVLQARGDLLTSGRPDGPRAIERLVRALREAGAEQLVLPRCGDCGRERPLTGLGDGARICGACSNRRVARANPCVICGSTTLAGRDRAGRPRCRAHPPWGATDPDEELAKLIAARPFGVSPATAQQAIRSIEPTRPGQLRLLWAVEGTPDLLTGRGAEGPPKISALAQALIDRGARGVVVPLCPFCQHTTDLKQRRDGLRCCGPCWSDTKIATCAACGRARPIGGRRFDGQPLCGTCRQHDPFNHRPCSVCGEMRLRNSRTDDGGICAACREIPTALCATCGERGPCYFAATDAPKCLPCSAKERAEAVCAACGKHRRVNNRTATGEPLCSNCGNKPKPCAGCGGIFRTSGRTPEGEPLCQTCWAKHPAAHRPCTQCGSVERLHRHGRCAACARAADLRQLLSPPGGLMRTELEPVFQALLKPPPRTVLHWIHKVPARRAVLQTLATERGPLTHEVLDRFATAPTIAYLRAALVAAGALPDRDEQLARLERWLAKTIARVSSAEERRILRNYTNWQPLRRLRRLPAGQLVTHGRAETVRIEIRNVARLLEWLHEGGTTLATCTQDQMDAWLSDGPTTRATVRGFLLWTSRRGHSRPLTAPVISTYFAARTIGTDQRWALVRHLVHDEQLKVADRAAGLLLLLFAQPVGRISRLTTEHIVDRGDTLALNLGRVPAEIPAPLDDLIRQLVERRNGRAATVPLEEPKWLFHSIYPGQPIDPHTLGRRLKAIGVPPQLARHASLMDIASELPAVVISRLLGFHQSTGDNWTRESQGFGADYAAEVSRR